MSRIEALRASMSEKGIDALLIEKRENYFYLTGFTGEDSFCVVTGDSIHLIVDFRFTTQAEAEILKNACACKVVEYSGDINETLKLLFYELGVEKIGYDTAHMSCKRFADVKKAVNAVKFVDAAGLIEQLRLRKDISEITLINEAVNIADRAFNALLQHIRPGISELEVAAELEFQMKKLGSSKPSFETIIASGERSALPHGTASGKTIRFGDALTIDFGATFQGYCSDMTRTVFIGKVKPQLKRIYEIVLLAQQTAVAGCYAGLSGCEVDALARDVIVGEGFGARFGHGTGHGLGLEIHENPRISPRYKASLEDGMVVTIEPGIYLPGIGGVRIEDVVVIDGTRPRVLTKTPKELLVV